MRLSPIAYQPYSTHRHPVKPLVSKPAPPRFGFEPITIMLGTIGFMVLGMGGAMTAIVTEEGRNLKKAKKELALKTEIMQETQKSQVLLKSLENPDITEVEKKVILEETQTFKKDKHKALIYLEALQDTSLIETLKDPILSLQSDTLRSHLWDLWKFQQKRQEEYKDNNNITLTWQEMAKVGNTYQALLTILTPSPVVAKKEPAPMEAPSPEKPPEETKPVEEIDYH